jgi:hypothetical protein
MFNSPRVASASSRLNDVLRNNQSTNEQPINRRLEDIFNQVNDETIDILGRSELEETNLPEDLNQRERFFRDYIKQLQEDNRKLRFDLSKLVQFVTSDGAVTSDKRLILAINDASLQPFDGEEVKNPAHWTERFVDTVALYKLNSDQAMELFKRKLKNKASDNYAQTTDARAKNSIHGALQWLDMTYIWTDNDQKKLQEIKKDTWRWEEETFETFISRFNAHFGSYHAQDTDKIDYLMNAFPIEIRNTIRQIYLQQAHTYKEMVQLLAKANMDEFRPKNKSNASIEATSAPATSPAVTNTQLRTNGAVNAVTIDNNEPLIGDVNYIQSRGKFHKSNRSNPQTSHRGNGAYRGQPNFNSQPRGGFNRRRNNRFNNNSFNNNQNGGFKVNSQPTLPNANIPNSFYHPFINPPYQFMGYPMFAPPPPNFNPNPATNPSITNIPSGNGK